MKLDRYFYFLFFCAFSTTLFAQDDDSAQLFEMTLEELRNVQISVASKGNESIINSPSSVYVFTSAEIERMGVSSVEELLNFVPGYFTGLDIEQGKAFRIGARGRSTALSESILFLVNGYRINDLYTGGISIINRLIPVENIKQIEVIRGPGSSLYGSNAFLGVVNIVTKERVNEIYLSYGNFNSISAAGNFSTQVGKARINGFIKGFSNDGYEFDDFEDLLGRTTDMTDPEQGVDIMVGAELENLKLEVRRHEREFKGFYGLGGVADFNNNEQSSQSMINLSYKLIANDNLNFNIKTGYRIENWKTKEVILPTGFDAGFGPLTADFFAGPFMKSKAFTFSTDASYKISDRNKLLAGISYEYAGINRAVSLATHDFITFEYFGSIREYPLPFNNTDDKRNIMGVFIQNRHIINDNLRITLGARLDSYNDFGSSINPRGAIVYSTPFKSTIKAMYGRAFRAPNYLELYDQNNPVDYGNAQLEAEDIQTLELAYMQNLNIFTGTITYFNNTIKNLIFLDPNAPPVNAPNNPLQVPSFYNSDEDINTSGIEVAVILKPIESLSFTSTYTYLMDDYSYMPENMASARINYRFGLFNLNINGIYHGNIEEVSTQSSYTVINSKLSMKVDNLTIFGRISNISDELYRTPTTFSDVGVVNRGRMMALGLKLEF